MYINENMLNQLDCSLDENHREMVVMTMDYFRRHSHQRRGESGTQPPQLCSRSVSNFRDSAKSTISAGYGATVHPLVNTSWGVPTMMAANDARSIAILLSDIGGWGTKVRISTKNGIEYLILTGYPGLRNRLKGTRYKIGNAKLVDMGIGKYGIRGSTVKGFKLSCWVAVGIEVAEWLYSDERIWTDLFGAVGVELVKAGIATAVGYAAGVVAGLLITSAAAPLAFGAVFVFAVGIGLNVLDNHFGIKNSVKAGLRYATDHIEYFSDKIREINSTDLQRYAEQTVADIAASIADGLYKEAKDWVIRKTNLDGLNLPNWPSAPRMPSIPNLDLPRIF